ncbi:anti-sigma factor [Lentzea sp. HUAS12]|uniref:anti-sigma factor n=1 Tax=Lentzea sp. HUAS12 TaxID=2951806 RepID=UPI00209DAC42|nr:anti-sigma factor [Lentzea sp. HUAS12]USX55542.1 anti-sigma factor [Lentzea sp. HUAS12]
MSHADPDQLTLVALGEQPTDRSTSDHVRGCAPCRAELASLREVVALGRESHVELDLPMPSEAVWDRITAEVDRRNTTVVAVPPQRPRRRVRALLAVAAAAAAIGAASAVVVDRAATSTPVAAEQLLARAQLSRFGTAPGDAQGTVRVVRAGDHAVMRVAVAGMPAPQGLYQVWLYDGVDTMIPLGVLTGGEVELPVPAEVDLTRFKVVDVSAQRLGQQEHGVSVLRGELG